MPPLSKNKTVRYFSSQKIEQFLRKKKKKNSEGLPRPRPPIDLRRAMTPHTSRWRNCTIRRRSISAPRSGPSRDRALCLDRVAAPTDERGGGCEAGQAQWAFIVQHQRSPRGSYLSARPGRGRRCSPASLLPRRPRLSTRAAAGRNPRIGPASLRMRLSQGVPLLRRCSGGRRIRRLRNNVEVMVVGDTGGV